MLRYRNEGEIPKGLRARIAKRHRPADQFRADEKAVATHKPTPARSKLEDMAYRAILEEGLPTPEREVKFIDGRGFRFDLAWPDQRIAVEVQGGTWSHGRHVRGAGYEMDCRKMTAAQTLGWTVLYVTQAMILRGEMVAALEALFGERAPEDAVRAIFPPSPKSVREDGKPLRDIMAHLADYPGAITSEISGALDMADTLVRRIIRRALVDGAIVRTGTHNGYRHWLPGQVPQ